MSKRLNSELSYTSSAAAVNGSKMRKTKTNENVLLKVMNRQQSGYFAVNKRSHQAAYKEVPTHLNFCLKEIVPFCYLQGHVFMGLTSCGQFLISYKVTHEYEESITNYYNFTASYKYELFFWIYRPHLLLSKYINVCLFDDHGVDDIKTVSITQWSTDQQTLIVHGASETDDHESYFTIVRVPKLGCLDCKQMRDEQDEEMNRQDILCIKCNMTIHTKYRMSDSGPKFNSKYNLNCPGYIIMTENSFIHTVHVALEMNQTKKQGSNVISHKYIGNYLKNEDTKRKKDVSVVKPKVTQILNPSNERKLSIVDEIIADFAEYEIETESKCSFSPASSCGTSGPLQTKRTDNFDELVITCSANGSPSNFVDFPSSYHSPTSSTSQIRLLNHQTNTNIELRLTNNHLKNRSLVTTINLQNDATPTASSSSTTPNGPSSSTNSSRRSYFTHKTTELNVPKVKEKTQSAISDAANAYEFSEDNEKCEKISIFRKRRLADKKYEFSEDSTNEENIIPFNRLRGQVRSRMAPQQQQGFDISTSHHVHRASPNHGFRSPCGSPLGNRYLKSPPGMRSPSYYRQRSPSTSSPKPQLSSKKSFDPRDFNIQILSPSHGSNEEIPKFLIEKLQKLSEKKIINNENNINCDNQPVVGGMTDGIKETNPICSKEFVKIYVEEDDANSVVTTEEDDCISPGYHTSLPMEVHGSCYSTMQTITQTSYNKIKCQAVIITQNSFDMETFSFHVANYICAQNGKRYGILFDSAYELTHVCPLTETITCTMVLQFTANDAKQTKSCRNCSLTIDCVTHRKIYQCRSLFTWNMTTGEWNVLDYGNLTAGPYLEMKKLATNYKRLLTKLRKFTKKLFNTNIDSRTYDYLEHLRILDSNNEKTKTRLVDLKNMIEFYRRQVHDNSSDNTDSDEYSDDDDENGTIVGDNATSDTISDDDDI